MKKVTIPLMVLAVTMTVWATTSMADTPLMMNYQGFLADSAGAALTGDYEMVFSIYDDADNGTQLWSSGPIYVTVDAGYFSYVIGADSALSPECFNGADRWLGVQVLPDAEIRPRVRLTSVPYAYQTLKSDTAAVGGGWVVTGGGRDDTYTYPYNVTGTSVGVGTDLPSSRLDVDEPGSLDPFTVGTAGQQNLIVTNEGTVGIGSNVDPEVSLHVQGADIGLWSYHLHDEDIVVEDDTAVIGLYSQNDGYKGSAVVFGHLLEGSLLDKWAIIKETHNAPFGGNGLRFTYSTDADHTDDVPFMRIDTSGGVSIGAMYPGAHKLYVLGTGASTDSAAVVINNSSTDGIALHCTATSSDLPLLVSQYGSGPILRCDSWTGEWHPVFTVENNGRTKVRGVLEIQSLIGETLIEMGEGLDYAEGFDVSDNSSVEPGAVLVIDPDNPGQLTVSSRPYDRTVAGIAAGANGLGSGVRLGAGQFDFDVALAGRVYCNVDASFGAIQPGDLLTTSPTPGYAMKVTDYTRAQGAILGKAMQPIEQGQKGSILVLVTLQ